MKELLIIRHGKAERPKIGGFDFDRHLVDKGVGDCKIVADQIKSMDWIPEEIVSSTAERAKETAIAMQSVWGAEVVEIRFDEKIYMADYSTLIHLIGTLDNKYTRIAIFGHNSGFSDLVSGLTNEPIWLATAACGLVRFQVDSWEEVISDMGKLVSVISAKELR